MRVVSSRIAVAALYLRSPYEGDARLRFRLLHAGLYSLEARALATPSPEASALAVWVAVASGTLLMARSTMFCQKAASLSAAMTVVLISPVNWAKAGLANATLAATTAATVRTTMIHLICNISLSLRGGTHREARRMFGQLSDNAC